MPSSGVQYLIINALDTLDLIIWKIYDEEKGFWYIRTPSPVLPRAALLQNGDIVPLAAVQNYDETE